LIKKKQPGKWESMKKKKAVIGAAMAAAIVASAWSFGGNTNPRDKDTFILRMVVERAVDGTVSVVEREHIPCASSGEKNRNNYQPVPYEEGSEEYKRTLSKLDGTFNGANLSIGYGYSANE